MRRRRYTLTFAGIALVVSAVACVDLFHSTDFETLCTSKPADPRCAGDAALVPDAVSEPAVDPRRPHPDFCSWSSAKAKEQALRACAWLGACEGPLGESAFGPCTVRASLAYDCNANPSLRPAGEADELWSCLATVQSCGDVDRCVFSKGSVESCIAVNQGSFTACGAANDGVRITCAAPGGGRPTSVEPCALLGKTCTRVDGKTGSVALCGGAQRVACSTSTCSGSNAVDCQFRGTAAFDQGLDCAASGGTCVLGDAGNDPACTPNAKAPACDGDTAPACLGNTASTAVACVGGREIRVNCAALDLGCDVSAIVGGYDVTAACAVKPATCTSDDTCEGTTITSCGRGATYSVDCRSAGLKGGCKVMAGRAVCVP